MLIYLAAPIDQAGGSVADLRTWAYEAAAKRGVTLFDPGSAYWNAPAAGLQVNALNRSALEIADAVLALLPEGVPSIGTPMELQTARGWGLPWAVVSNAPSLIIDEMRAEGERVFGEDQEEVGRAIWRLYIRHGEQIREDEQLNKQVASMLNGQVLKWTGRGEAPVRHYPDDAGWDLTCSAYRQIGVGEFIDVPCDIQVQLPEGTWGFITGRSSTLRRRGLLVAPAIIDGGYRGPIYAGVYNLGPNVATVNQGDRLAQLIPIPLVTGGAVRVDELDPSDRGARGFGSTGT